MPSNKKKNSADKKRQKQQRRTRQATAQDLKEVAPKFRQLLLSARQEYAKVCVFCVFELIIVTSLIQIATLGTFLQRRRDAE